MRIYGAGIAGLLAGCVFPTAEIFEANGPDTVNHKALLRFRSSAVGDAVGIDFRKVRVHKGLFHDSHFVAPDIRFANWYSQKVIGRLADRSIWNLDAVDRFIAPEDFLAQLAARCAGRVHWRHPLSAEEVMECEDQAISTIPMQLMANFVDHYRAEPLEHPEFKHAPIAVRRWRVEGADVFQTVYFPSPATTLYRASMTGDMLIAEYAGVPDDNLDAFSAFGLHGSTSAVQPLEQTSQRYGKIAPIDDAWRKRFILDLTTQHRIFSLGRFGTWRNILLDDVLKDLAVIKKLMNTTTYDRMRHGAK